MSSAPPVFTAPIKLSPSFKRNGFDAFAAHVFKRRKLHFFHHAQRGGEEHIFVFGELAHGQNGGNFFVFVGAESRC